MEEIRMEVRPQGENEISNPNCLIAVVSFRSRSHLEDWGCGQLSLYSMGEQHFQQ